MVWNTPLILTTISSYNLHFIPKTMSCSTMTVHCNTTGKSLPIKVSKQASQLIKDTNDNTKKSKRPLKKEGESTAIQTYFKAFRNRLSGSSASMLCWRSRASRGTWSRSSGTLCKRLYPVSSFLKLKLLSSLLEARRHITEQDQDKKKHLWNFAGGG